MNVRQDAAMLTSDSITIMWDVPTSDGGSPITKYTIEHTQVGSAAVNVVVNDVANRKYQFINLAASTSNSFKVTATNAVGNSA